MAYKKGSNSRGKDLFLKKEGVKKKQFSEGHGVRKNQNFSEKHSSSDEASTLRHLRGVVGQHSVREALKIRPGHCRILWIKKGSDESSEVRELLEIAPKHLKIEVVAENRLLQWGGVQGVVLFVEGRPEVSLEALGAKKSAIVLALDGIEDPHNLGALLRTSWLLGVSAILIPQDRAVGLTPTVHKVACGGAEHVPLLEVHPLAAQLEKLKEMGYWVYGLSHRSSQSLTNIKFPEKIVFVLGAEDKGMRITTERACDETLSIPQKASEASYNASVAGAMVLFEAFRQHAQRGI